MATLAELQQVFHGLGIDYARPGFYDEPAFIRAEQQNGIFLEYYAEYVERKEYSEEYKAHARRIVIQAANFLSRELAAHERQGACIDASGTLMRMLEREGIWSYMAGGATAVEFPEASRLPTQYFFPFVHPNNPAKTGHLWLRVPPFVVVDVSLAIQGWSRRQKRYIPAVLASEISAPAEVGIDDLIEGELMELLLRQGRVPTMRNLTPVQRSTMRKFPAFYVTSHDIRLKYVPTQVSAMDAPLENMRNLCLGGRYPAQLYAEFKAAQEG